MIIFSSSNDKRRNVHTRANDFSLKTPHLLQQVLKTRMCFQLSKSICCPFSRQVVPYVLIKILSPVVCCKTASTYPETSCRKSRWSYMCDSTRVASTPALLSDKLMFVYSVYYQIPFFSLPLWSEIYFCFVSTQFPLLPCLIFFEYFQLLTFPTTEFPICESVISDSEHSPTGYKTLPEFGKEVRIRWF